jgi:hypothetical protein
VGKRRSDLMRNDREHRRGRPVVAMTASMLSERGVRPTTRGNDKALSIGREDSFIIKLLMVV